MGDFTPLNKALIMAGGVGTRQKYLNMGITNPMRLFLGKPILEYSIELCRMNGIRDIAISIFHFGHKIKEYFGDGKKFGVNIIYVEEDMLLGTGGILKTVRGLFNGPFLMCNAEELKDIDIREMYYRHVKNKALVTLALTESANPSEYGVVHLSGDLVTRFVEKPKYVSDICNWISAGLYIINPEAIDSLPEGHSAVEYDLFPKLASEGRLYGYRFDGQWFDTGTDQQYREAEMEWRGFSDRSAASRVMSGRIRAVSNYHY